MKYHKSHRVRVANFATLRNLKLVAIILPKSQDTLIHLGADEVGTDPKHTVCEGVDWIQVTEDRVQDHKRLDSISCS